MSNKNILKILSIIVLALVLGVMLKVTIFSDNGSNTNNNSNISNGLTTTSDTVDIVTTSSDTSVSEVNTETYSSYNTKINLSDLSYEGNGVSINNNTIKITSAGTYYISGTLEDGNIVVEATKNDEVVLVFDNANITCSTTSPLNVIQAKSVIINLVDGSTNTFADSSTYTIFTEDDEPDGTIFSKADLYITGKGTLKLNANYQDAIVSKDTLSIVDCNIEIISNDDGIRGKDYVSINNATINIKASEDGIKSTNTEDTSLGYIAIKDSNITITAEADGIQAETVLNITNSDITIKTTGDTSDSTVSSKGVKAGTEVTINSGNINIISTDDSIHSNAYVIINNGKINISSGDDGIHADTNIVINDGTINITKSYEGIESSYIEINDGNISVIASDDGVNICGGNDSSAFGRMGANSFSNVTDSNRKLVINGGNIYVNSNGDGLDANGSIEITGGYVEVAGSNNGGNGALDYDATCNVSGGTLIIYGATGMWQNPSTSSTQYSICYATSGKSGDNIVLKDSNGNEIESFEAKKNYGTVTVSSANLKKGETYTLYVNGTSVGTQELTSIVTSNSSNSMGGMQGNNGMGMNRGMR